MEELIYYYDGSFYGFLCCIFSSYAYRETPSAIRSQEDASLFACRTIPTDPEHARRVLRKVRLCSPTATDLLRRGFLTCLPDKELFLYRMVAKLLREGPLFLRNPADETLYPILQAIRRLHGEVHHLKGFLRFSELGGVLSSEITPKNRVLPLLRSHFCARYQGESFFIYDRTHKEALFYACGKSVIRLLEDFQMAEPDEAEAHYRLLWKRFYDTVAIRERENPKCRMTQMPKRFWENMTEFQGPSHFTPRTSPAVSSNSSVPGGIPAPGRHPGSAPSDLG